MKRITGRRPRLLVHERRDKMRSSISSMLAPIIICVFVGALGGALATTVVQSSLGAGVSLGVLYGALFALLAARRAVSPGAGLLWGLGFAFALWMAIPAGIVPVLMGGAPAMGMLDTARAHFPELIAYTICYGAPLGLALGTWRVTIAERGMWNAEYVFKREDNPQAETIPHSTFHVPQSPYSWTRAIIVGGLAGIVGGWAFGKWMAQVNFYPLI